MKEEYDFSKAERGKFYHDDASIKLPLYLDDDVRTFVQRIAERRKTDPSSVVSQLIRTDMELAETMK